MCLEISQKLGQNSQKYLYLISDIEGVSFLVKDILKAQNIGMGYMWPVLDISKTCLDSLFVIGYP